MYMKKWFLLFLAGICGIAAHAQIKLGIKGGANFSTITSDNYGEIKTISGFNAGALASFPLFKGLSLQPEIMYSGQGAKSIEANSTANLVMNYMNFPVLLKYSIPAGIFVETGPQIGLLLNAKLKFYNFNEDEKPNSQSTDFSWAFGLGYLIKDVNLGFDARYNLGLTNFRSDSYLREAKHNVIEVGLFYVFGIKATGTGHE
jgi:hypothetical protein